MHKDEVFVGSFNMEDSPVPIKTLRIIVGCSNYRLILPQLIKLIQTGPTDLTLHIYARNFVFKLDHNDMLLLHRLLNRIRLTPVPNPINMVNQLNEDKNDTEHTGSIRSIIVTDRYIKLPIATGGYCLNIGVHEYQNRGPININPLDEHGIDHLKLFVAGKFQPIHLGNRWVPCWIINDAWYYVRYKNPLLPIPASDSKSNQLKHRIGVTGMIEWVYSKNQEYFNHLLRSTLMLHRYTSQIILDGYYHTDPTIGVSHILNHNLIQSLTLPPSLFLSNQAVAEQKGVCALSGWDGKTLLENGKILGITQLQNKKIGPMVSSHIYHLRDHLPNRMRTWVGNTFIPILLKIPESKPLQRLQTRLAQLIGTNDIELVHNLLFNQPHIHYYNKMFARYILLFPEQLTKLEWNIIMMYLTKNSDYLKKSVQLVITSIRTKIEQLPPDSQFFLFAAMLGVPNDQIADLFSELFQLPENMFGEIMSRVCTEYPNKAPLIRILDTVPIRLFSLLGSHCCDRFECWINRYVETENKDKNENEEQFMSQIFDPSGRGQVKDVLISRVLEIVRTVKRMERVGSH